MPTGIYKRIKKGECKNCLLCKSIFYVFPYRKSVAKFCSAKCQMKAGVLTRRGMPCSPSHRMKIGKANSGKNSANWKGGVTPINLAIRNSAKYKSWREKVFKRDKYTCVFCGKKGGKLNADHIKSFSLFPKLRLKVSNGRTLCEPCHRETPNFAGKSRKILSKITKL